MLDPTAALFSATLPQFASIQEFLTVVIPDDPVFCLRETPLRQALWDFQAGFPGDIAYTTRANADPAILGALSAGGIRHHAVSSLAEIKVLRKTVPDAIPLFLNPVKSRLDIVEAYKDFGVRVFGAAHRDEVSKIRSMTENGPAMIAISLSPGQDAVSQATLDARPEDAVRLLRLVDAAGLKAGLCVGPRRMATALDVSRALETAAAVVRQAGVPVKMIALNDFFAPPETSNADLFAALRTGLGALSSSPDVRILAMAGEAIVGSAATLLLRVTLRNGGTLHLNEGVYGSLSHAGKGGRVVRSRLHRNGWRRTAPLMSFAAMGPSGAPDDVLGCPLELPGDVMEGDWIEISNMAACASAGPGYFSSGSPPASVIISEESRPPVA